MFYRPRLDCSGVATAMVEFFKITEVVLELVEKVEPILGEKLRTLFEKIRPPILAFLRALRDPSPKLATDAAKILSILRTFMGHFKEGCEILKKKYAQQIGKKQISPPKKRVNPFADLLESDKPLTMEDLAKLISAITSMVKESKTNPKGFQENLEFLAALLKRVLDVVKQVIVTIPQNQRESVMPLVRAYVAKLQDFLKHEGATEKKTQLFLLVIKSLSALHTALQAATSAPCSGCGQPISAGEYLECGDKKFHKNCFRRQAPKCFACRLPLEGSAWSVSGKTFHENCMRCKVCRKGPLDSCVVTDDGSIYCERHIPSSSLLFCAKCGQGITGECYMDNDKYYHGSCLNL